MKLRALTTIGAWALGDQVLSSATNFAAGLVVARSVGPAGYGSFTLAFGTWVVLLGTTRAMLVQPYTVAASGAPPDEWAEATRATAAAVLLFGITFGVISIIVGALLGPHTPTGAAFLALGAFAAPLGLQDFWRFAAFSRTQPRVAAYNDGIWAVVQGITLAALLITHTLTPALAIVSWGLGALAGAVYGAWQFGVYPSIRARERRFIRDNAALAGWFGVANASYQVGSYGAILVVGAGVGAAALGGLSSATNMMSPARIIVSSGESMMLPAVARAAKAEEQEALPRICKVYSLADAAFFALVGGVLVVAGPRILQILFGAGYVRFAPLMAPVAAAAALSGLASGLVLGLRALEAGRKLAMIQLASSAIRLLLAAVSLPFGLLAVAWSLAISEAIRTVIVWMTFERAVAAPWGAHARISGHGDDGVLLLPAQYAQPQGDRA